MILETLKFTRPSEADILPPISTTSEPKENGEGESNFHEMGGKRTEGEREKA